MGTPQGYPFILAVAVGTVAHFVSSSQIPRVTEMSKGYLTRRYPFDMAVAVGFEPTVSFHPHTLSRRAPLAARTRHRGKAYKHEAGRTESVRPAYVSARRIGDLNP